MKLLYLATAFVLSATTAPAQQTFYAAQPCDQIENIFATVYSYGETPLFTGNGIQFGNQANTPYFGGSMFFVNQDTGTWSLISAYPDGMACMVANGTDFKPYTD